MFRGREVQHPELGRRILDQVAEQMEDIAKVEAYPRLDGRNMTMVLGPDKKAIEALKKARALAAEPVPDVSEPDATATAPDQPVEADTTS